MIDDSTDKFTRRIRLRLGENIQYCALLNDHAIFNDGNLIADFLNDLHLMGNQNNGQLKFLVDIF
ncbi:hypothetical protein SDC9_208450 [bioreactor metagenome]|uniref:Uncharacterized protein n=1 Tax=bioreactor metagenome TaxID=1076179 RepID=A0A645JDH2_9ZZZZ